MTHQPHYDPSSGSTTTYIPLPDEPQFASISPVEAAPTDYIHTKRPLTPSRHTATWSNPDHLTQGVVILNRVCQCADFVVASQVNDLHQFQWDKWFHLLFGYNRDIQKGHNILLYLEPHFREVFPPDRYEYREQGVQDPINIYDFIIYLPDHLWALQSAYRHRLLIDPIWSIEEIQILVMLLYGNAENPFNRDIVASRRFSPSIISLVKRQFPYRAMVNIHFDTYFNMELIRHIYYLQCVHPYELNEIINADSHVEEHNWFNQYDSTVPPPYQESYYSEYPHTDSQRSDYTFDEFHDQYSSESTSHSSSDGYNFSTKAWSGSSSGVSSASPVFCRSKPLNPRAKAVYPRDQRSSEYSRNLSSASPDLGKSRPLSPWAPPVYPRNRIGGNQDNAKWGRELCDLLDKAKGRIRFEFWWE
ncbi:uncharacterized protein I206_101578 [Kwoniella pini CBS 10737]|uniref:Uncharacterized protein n=1 Tax=Kwoniella pini CBS 10737 TaxID=1296096 RepID=A0A1B9HWB3_9TREE|nr:uncharacterized protein I206_06452 [Kwoniella pini CBS 10737]OCF47550.1 hypothetical protein I206_06452 [Kwoniella pini CBS 10737]